MTNKQFLIAVGAVVVFPAGVGIFVNHYMNDIYEKQLAISQKEDAAPVSGDAWTLPLREEYAKAQKDFEKASVELELEVKRLEMNVRATEKALKSLDRRLVWTEHAIRSLGNNDYVGGDDPIHVAPNANVPVPGINTDTHPTCDKKTLIGCCITWKNGFGDLIPVDCPTEAK